VLLLIVLALTVGGFLLAARGRKPASIPLAVPQGAEPGDLTGLKNCAYQAEGSKTVFDAQCGTLTVAENRDVASSRLIALPVVRILAKTPNPAEPVFWLMGGPGETNLSWTPPGWILQKHDVVLVGYRGVDGSVVLDCPGVAKQMEAHTGVDMFSEKARSDLVAAARECAIDLEKAGVDIAGYTIPAVVEDVDSARLALGYGPIDLFSESYGTRVAQIYAYMHPDSLKRVVQIGVNTPGHFIYDPTVYDKMIAHLSELCAADPSCSQRTADLAQTIYTVNHNMPSHWLFFPIDPGTVRMAAQFLLFSNKSMSTILDVYLAAGQGDPSGLAIGNLIMRLQMSKPMWALGEYLSKGGPADLPRYRGLESVSLGNSIMGAPLSELIWPMSEAWPIAPLPEKLREFQETDVDMLLINGTIDFSTPPTALDASKPYFHNAQMVLLPEFSHVGDVYEEQPEAFKELITSYFDTGVADSSLYTYEPLSFDPGTSMTVIAKGLVALMIVLPMLISTGAVLLVRRIRKRRRQTPPAKAV